MCASRSPSEAGSAIAERAHRISPDAQEICDEGDVDEDCDGLSDDEDSLVTGQSTWYRDGDADTYGDAESLTAACDPPTGYVGNDEDCEDEDDATYPGASEVCGDGVVNDCDSDEATARESCALSGTLSLSEADAKLVGGAAESYAGFSVSGAGDVNGDGTPDLLVGGPYADGPVDARAGAAWLVHGSATMTGTRALSAADAEFLGENAGDYAGISVSGAGDTDGDGLADLLVGAYLANAGGSDSGVAYLVLGPATGRDLEYADAILRGENSLDRAGGSVSGAGDVDGDGLADLLVGAYNENLGGVAAGAAYLVLGPATATELLSADAKLRGEKADDYAGYSVSGAGDTDGDGAADLLVGAPYDDTGGMNAGAAYLVLAPVVGTIELSEADAKLLGDAAGDEAGVAVSGAGDVNGDGAADLLIGAYAEDTGGSNAGAAYLVYGPVTEERELAGADAKLVGEAAGDIAGVSVSGTGDVDGDGLADLLVGARYQDTVASDAGAAYLVYGPVAGETRLLYADVKLLGGAEGDGAGHAVSGAGDIDGDGVADLLVGAPYEDAGGEDAGAAWLVLGRSW